MDLILLYWQKQMFLIQNFQVQYFTAAKEIEQLGVKVLPIKTDIRFDVQVENAIEQVIKNFGSIDILDK